MGPTILFVCLAFAYAQAQTCVPETQPIGSFGQGVPRIDGTNQEDASPYSMIDIDGAAQMPPGIITGIEYRVFKLGSVDFQVWRPIDIVNGVFQLLETVKLVPTMVEEVIEVEGLNIPVQNKDRWGFSWKGSGAVPVKYSITLNEPNLEPYMAMQCSDCAANTMVGGQATFQSKVQKQFRMRAMMSQIVSTCPPPTTTAPTAPPITCTGPLEQPIAETNVRTTIMEHNDPESFPGNGEEPISVTLDYAPRSILSFDEKRMVLSVILWISTGWVNPHMTWCPENFGGVNQIRVKPNTVWLPEFNSYDFQGDTKPKMDGPPVIVMNTGHNIFYEPAKKQELQCKKIAETEESKDFECTMEFGSWTYTGNDLSPEPAARKLRMLYFQKHPKYEVLDAIMTKVDAEFECCPGVTYPTITMTITIRKMKDMDMKDMDKPDMEEGGEN